MKKPWVDCYLRPGLLGRVHIPPSCANCLEPAPTYSYGVLYPHVYDRGEMMYRLGSVPCPISDLVWVDEMLWIPVCDICAPKCMPTSGWFASWKVAAPVQCVKVKGVYALHFRNAEWAKRMADANDTPVLRRQDLPGLVSKLMPRVK